MPAGGLVTLGVLGGVALAKGGVALHQRNKAKKLEKANARPDYEIPEAANEAMGASRDSLGVAQTMAAQNLLPGQERIEAKLGQGAAQAIGGVREAGGGGAGMMAAIAGINTNQNNAIADLGVRAAEFKQDNMRNLQGAYLDMANAHSMYAGYQEKQWEWDKANPYLERAAAIRALKGASQQNAMGAIDTMGAGAIGYMGSGNVNFG
jgi:hypothetical protein